MKVTIKTWKELLKTPGVVVYGVGKNINPPYPYSCAFVEGMKLFCGKTIDVRIHNENGTEFLTEEGYIIEDWMIQVKTANFNNLYEKLTSR